MRWLVLGLVWLTMATTAAAVDDPPLREPAAAGVSASARFNEGRVLAERRDWPAAERKYREAIALDSASPEPWACQEALRLLEYLGHAYLAMGRLDDARAVVARLRPLDPREAEELDETIARAARR
jgi:tetratricopeptide (TPR) repeat protein